MSTMATVDAMLGEVGPRRGGARRERERERAAS
jgi:hypothetical protein